MNKKHEPVILSAVRTPIARFQGALAGIDAPKLGAAATKAAVERAGISNPADIDGNPIALRPGRTWVHLMTPASYLEGSSEGAWRVKFVQPHDPPGK